MRYFLELQYNGTGFHGWQIQPNGITVQQELTDRVSMLLKAPTSIVGCGRTDTGVHAREYFAHFDAGQLPDGAAIFLFKLNNMLHPNIAVRAIHLMADNAHARFSARWRSYEYVIIRRKDPFHQGLSWRCMYSVDIDRMNEAAQLLLGERDFACFCRSHASNNTNICTITEARWEEDGDLLRFHITANRFLRNMVRAIVGTLVDIGRGRSDGTAMQRILDSGDRSEAGTSAPAQGLYLSRVQYPEAIFHQCLARADGQSEPL
ncbi:MAG: tRNA pseudouridine(38-40) synthase TruA [Flavobacteriales bacterium]|nr:tRNA pseudouridine(38-40) synthase TruA [Flavobacteriales bacterium]